MFRLTVPPASCGRKVVRSVALRMPSFSMSAGRYVSTGFGPTSSAVGMFEPVTITSTTVATRWSASRDVDTVSWPNEIEARSKGIPDYAPSGTADEWSLDDKLLSLDLRRLSKLPDKQQVSFVTDRSASARREVEGKHHPVDRDSSDGRRPPLQHNEFIGHTG